MNKVSQRREYELKITVNSRQIHKVVIDSHYEEKHAESINDELILDLVKLLDGGTYPVESKQGAYKYFVTDDLALGDKFYKLVWLLEDDELYIGVVNAHRRKSGISK